MGESFVPIYITSGNRQSIEQANIVLRNKLPKITKTREDNTEYQESALKNYYSWNSGRFYNPITEKFHREDTTCAGVGDVAKEKIQTISSNDIEEAVKTAKELMEKNILDGTDHRTKRALDFRTQNNHAETTFKLEELARKNITKILPTVKGQIPLN